MARNEIKSKNGLFQPLISRFPHKAIEVNVHREEREPCGREPKERAVFDELLVAASRGQSGDRLLRRR
jgi:hypothetical protein